MTDIFSKSKRSKIMRSIRGKDTTPEINVRQLVFSMGYRYRLHCKDLPGCPDLVFTRLKKVIFVNGCFWHGHKKCARKRKPSKTNVLFWKNKIEKTKKRDKTNLKSLKKLGWDTLTIWECEIPDSESIKNKLLTFLSVV